LQNAHIFNLLKVTFLLSATSQSLNKRKIITSGTLATQPAVVLLIQPEVG